MPEKKWVFDSVTLSNFLLSGSTSILEKRYRKKGLITSQVFDEISASIREYPDLKGIDALIRTGSFELVSLSVPELKRYQALLGHLGKGEASSIVYTRSHRAVVVTDDRAARAQCSHMRVPFTGTIGILVAFVLDKQIKLAQANAVLLKMIQAGFYSPVGSISEITD